MRKNRKTKQDKVEHNSWLYALYSLIADTFFTFPQNAIEDESVFDLTEKLSKKGKLRQDTLLLVGWIVFCIAMVILCVSLTIEEYNRDACIGIGIFTVLAVTPVILKKFYFDKAEK